MKHVLPVFLVLILLTSCASVLNSPTTKVTLHTVVPSRIVCNSDTIPTQDNKAKITVNRKQKSLVITTISDSLVKEYEIPSKNSLAYYSNIFFNYGVGMLVDKGNPKRFTYPSHVFLNPKDSINPIINKEYAAQKGSTFLNIGIPYVNNFLLQPKDENLKNNSGFWGFSIGADYYYKDKRFVNFTASVASDFFLPVIAAVDIEGEYEIMSSVNFSVSNNYCYKRFSFGYGVSFARNFWHLRNGLPSDEPFTREPITKANNSIGLVFPTYYRIGKAFNVGINYKPSFYNLDSKTGFQYEHIISLEFVWKLHLGKIK